MTEPTSNTLILARAVCDASGTIEPQSSALLLQTAGDRGTLRVLAVGAPDDVYRHPGAASATQIDRTDSVLIPGLINAHAHLDLTHIGPKPAHSGPDFAAWADAIRTSRASEPEAIRASVLEGARLSLEAGTVAVGDIAGAPAGTPSLEPAIALADSGLGGISFLEFFAIGERANQSLDRALSTLDEGIAQLQGGSHRVRMGLQPHAPYTVQPDIFEKAAAEAQRRGVPVCTHLAEHEGEREFINAATGPQKEFLERLGLWTDDLLNHYGKGEHPVTHTEPTLLEAGTLAVHLNDCPDEAIDTLVETGSRVVYCPNASAYFGAEKVFGPHRYRDMIEAGLTVALGTDSIVNQPEARLSILDEARVLYRRDRTDPRVLLDMATVAGASALGLSPSTVSLTPGSEPLAVLSVRVDPGSDSPLDAVFTSDANVRREASTVFGG